MALHDLEELDDDLRAGSDQDLALAGLLGVVDAVEGIVENGGANHVGGIGRFSNRISEMRYLPRGNPIVSLPRLVSEESALNDSNRRGFCRPMLKRRSVSRSWPATRPWRLRSAQRLLSPAMVKASSFRFESPSAVLIHTSCGFAGCGG